MLMMRVDEDGIIHTGKAIHIHIIKAIHMVDIHIAIKAITHIHIIKTLIVKTLVIKAIVVAVVIVKAIHVHVVERRWRRRR